MFILGKAAGGPPITGGKRAERRNQERPKKDPGQRERKKRFCKKNGNFTGKVRSEYNLYEQLGNPIAEGAKSVRGWNNSAGWGKGRRQARGRNSSSQVQAPPTRNLAKARGAQPTYQQAIRGISPVPICSVGCEIGTR